VVNNVSKKDLPPPSNYTESKHSTNSKISKSPATSKTVSQNGGDLLQLVNFTVLDIPYSQPIESTKGARSVTTVQQLTPAQSNFSNFEFGKTPSSSKAVSQNGLILLYLVSSILSELPYSQPFESSKEARSVASVRSVNPVAPESSLVHSIQSKANGRNSEISRSAGQNVDGFPVT
jgi:hypothetical protein